MSAGSNAGVLIAQLGALDPLRLGVIARRSAMQFKKSTKRTDQIGSDLGVSHLLAGSLRRTGSRIRIAVQLIDAETESQLSAEQYERDGMDLLALQREVAEAIAREITTSFGVAHSNVHQLPIDAGDSQNAGCPPQPLSKTIRQD